MGWVDDRPLAESVTDETGRFTLPMAVSRHALDLLVFAPWGIRVGHARFTADDLAAGRDLEFQVPAASDPRDPFELEPPLPRAMPVVIPVGLARFYRAIAVAMQAGHFSDRHGVLGVIGWVHGVENELEELEQGARSLAQGDARWIPRLRSLLESAPSWALSQSAPHLPSPLHDQGLCFAIPRDPYAVLAAGVVLDRLDQPGGAHVWLERCIGFYLTRVAAVQHAFGAGERVLAGELPAAQFEEIVRQANPYPAKVSDDHAIHSSGVAAHGASAQDSPKILLPPEMWDTCTRQVEHCLGQVAVVALDTVTDRDVPVAIERVQPAAICKSMPPTLTLLPRRDGAFPARAPQSSDVGLVLWDGVEEYPLEVASWDRESIEVRVPDTARVGCGSIYWQEPTPSLAERVAERTASCRPFLPEAPRGSTASGGKARISIVGPPVINFAARSARTNTRGADIDAESCAEAVLVWNVTAGVCADGRDDDPGRDAARLRVTLRVGERLLIADAPFQGQLTVREPATVVYELEAEAFAGVTSCGSGRASVRVTRYGRLTLSVPDRPFYPRGTVPVRVQVSCAPVNDLVISVDSDSPGILPGGTGTLPAHETETTVSLVPPGPSLGEVTLTVSVDHADLRYVSDEVRVRVSRSSCVDGDPSLGGQWEFATVRVTEVTESCPPATALKDASAEQYANAGTRLLQTGGKVAEIVSCWDKTQADVDACTATEAAEHPTCEAEHAQRLLGCNITCTSFTNCDSIQCTSFTNCDSIQCTSFTGCGSIQCTSFTNCNAFWVTDPRRYACWTARGVCVAAAAVQQAACWTARGVCVAAKAVERAACWTARGVCIAAKAVERAACWTARGVCVAAAAVASAACVAGSAALLVGCHALAWTKGVACKAGVVLGNIVCSAVKIAEAVFNVAVAILHIFAGIVLRTVGGIVSGVCTVVNWALGQPGTTATPSETLKVVGIHVAVLHTGKVLIFSYDEGRQPVTHDSPADPTALGDSDRALCALWDPKTGSATYVPLNRNLFCSGHCFAADGQLFVAGGQFPLPLLPKSFGPELPRMPRGLDSHTISDLSLSTELAPGADRDLHRFDPVSEGWMRIRPDMEKGRWYPSVATLPDGRAFVISGTDAMATIGGFLGGIQDTYQIVDPLKPDVSPAVPLLAPFRPENPLRWHIFHLYPFVHVVPSGEVLVHYKRLTRFFDPATGIWGLLQGGSGSMYAGLGGPAVETQWPYSRTGPGPGTSVLLPLLPTRDGDGTVRYPPGRIMILGGGGDEGPPEPAEPGRNYTLSPTTDATNTAEILDLAEAPLRWRYTGPHTPGNPTQDPKPETSPMTNPRVMPDAVLLPDGKVLVVNGARVGQSGGFLAHLPGPKGPPMGATSPVMEPELFDPESETWEVLCGKEAERLYHATAVLLPDGRVLTAGHDGFLNMYPHDNSEYRLEIFSPPYLFRTPRPVIRSAPKEIKYDEVFTIELQTAEAAGIASVVFIRQSSITHQINTDQRYVGLAFQQLTASQLSVQTPPNGAVAPPGYYMLFVVDQAGVPSEASWVRVLGPPTAL